jgi:predicted Mrr-cat superfamily restriction endonuclease
MNSQFNFKSELDAFADFLPSIDSNKKYWLVRTKAGELYDTFRSNSIVALNHNEVSLSDISAINDFAAGDPNKKHIAIKSRVLIEHEKRMQIDSEDGIDTRRVSLISSQIYKFIYEMTKGDTVLIPSYNSDIISFGIIQESNIGNFGPDELRKINSDAILKKRVKWIADLKRLDMDPYLFKMFTAHQAINEVGQYADVIERSIGDFFILDDEAHTIINVENEKDIPAVDLFKMGAEILSLVDEISAYFDLDISSKDIQVTINLNSPGKIDLKSRIKKTTIILGLILLVAGGGYEDKAGHSFKTDGLPGIIKAIDEFMSNRHQRNTQAELVNAFKDSIKVKNPEDLIKLLKQFDTNKDVPK